LLAKFFPFGRLFALDLKRVVNIEIQSSRSGMYSRMQLDDLNGRKILVLPSADKA
jgi:hypothetical protein